MACMNLGAIWEAAWLAGVIASAAVAHVGDNCVPSIKCHIDRSLTDIVAFQGTLVTSCLLVKLNKALQHQKVDGNQILMGCRPFRVVLMEHK